MLSHQCRHVYIIKEPNKQVRDYIKLCLYTGARQRNVKSMRWKNISFDSEAWFTEDRLTVNTQDSDIILQGKNSFFQNKLEYYQSKDYQPVRLQQN